MKPKLMILLCVVAMGMAGCSSSDDGGGNGGAKGSGDGTGRPAGPAASGTLTYTPPEGWNVVENPSDGVLSVASRPPKPDDTYYENITFMEMAAILVPGALDAWGAKTVERLNAYMDNVKVLSNRTVQFGAVEAQEIVYTYTQKLGMEFDLKAKTWLVRGSDKAYQLTAVALAPAYPTYEATFDAAARSLRWQ